MKRISPSLNPSAFQGISACFWLLGFLALYSLGFAAPQSYKQIAQTALQSGDYSKATEYFQKWTEADPTDAQSLYNLACCYAALKRSNDALASLRKAADAGWSDAEHTADDSDLVSLHSLPDFPKVLEAIAYNAASRSGGYIVQSCLQERLGEYLVILPDDYNPSRKYPLVILLHGYGQSPQECAKAAPLINAHDFIYAVPHGSYVARDSEGKGYCFLRELDNYREDTSSAAAAADWIMRVADDMIRHYPIKGNHFWLVGFNQGGALAHVVAAHNPARLLGYVAHGAYIIKGLIADSDLAKEKQHNLRVLITHAKDDPSVAFMEGVYASNMLKQAGVNVTFFEIDDAPGLSPAACEKIFDWITAP